jgi:ketosteroid isomerase-like protein
LESESQRSLTKETSEVIEKYLKTRDSSLIAEDAEFLIMGSNELAKGRDSIMKFLQYFNRQAFTADLKPRNLIVGAGKAAVEADFCGRQNLVVAGVSPAKSGREVCVPICITYEVRDHKIKSAHIYFETEALRQSGGL